MRSKLFEQLGHVVILGDYIKAKTHARRTSWSQLAGYVYLGFFILRNVEHRLEAGKKDLGRAISEAKRPPCTRKYSGGTLLNVFALIPLAIDTITDTGRKW